jgi:2-amino-4-hydroxy-6-hydroxymethyldihydropteridine diphosphokinase
MLRRYFIGLGSNIEPHSNFALALSRLLPRFGAVDISRIVQTAPVGGVRGVFLNAVVSFETDMPAVDVKTLFCEIETGLGRDRSHPDCAHRDRPIDLDILIDLPAPSRAVPPAFVPAENYYRSAALELIHTLGLACVLGGGRQDGVTSIMFGNERIGLAPARLLWDPVGHKPTIQKRKAALVTGGAVRLGKELALTLARAGYDIALHYNASAQAAELTADLCRGAGVRCEAFRADFSDAGAIPDFMDDVASRFPHLELLVNSASVYDSNPIAQTTPELLDRQWSVNFKAPFLLMKAFYLRIGHGAIVNVLDNKIAFNQFQYAAYLTSKKALAEATKMAALEFAPDIRVNGIAPGVVLPASTRDEAYLEWRKEAIPVGRLGDPERLCQGFMALVTNDFINGQILFVDGGESASFTGRNAPSFIDKPARPPMAAFVPALEIG